LPYAGRTDHDCPPVPGRGTVEDVVAARRFIRVGIENPSCSWDEQNTETVSARNRLICLVYDLARCPQPSRALERAARWARV
jgi:hypothetical protein